MEQNNTKNNEISPEKKDNKNVLLKRTSLVQEKDVPKQKKISLFPETEIINEKPILKSKTSKDLPNPNLFPLSLNEILTSALTKELDINDLMIKTNFSNEEILKKGFSLYKAEKIELISKGFFGIIENETIGILLLTQYRLVFKFLIETMEKKMNFSKDFFKG